jgi:hypothetical protein
MIGAIITAGVALVAFIGVDMVRFAWRGNARAQGVLAIGAALALVAYLAG